MRTEKTDNPLHLGAIDEQTADGLFDTAADLTYAVFGEDTSDDHIEWAYQRLVGNWRWGLGTQGVVTVH